MARRNTAGQTTSITPPGSSAESISYLSDGQDLPATMGSIHLYYNALGISGESEGPSNLGVLRTPNGQLLGQYNTAPYYYLIDPTGSVAGLTNTSGTLVDSYTYSPYGTQTTTTNTIYNPFGYQSGTQVPNSDLIHFGARYYNPTTGTWTQPDPSRQDSGYVYAGDDPTNESDPTGRSLLGDCAKGAATGLVVGAVGADETGAGAVGAAATGAAEGCLRGGLENLINSATKSTIGTVAGKVADAADAVESLL